MTYVIKSKLYKTYYNKEKYPLFVGYKSQASRFLDKKSAIKALNELRKTLYKKTQDEKNFVLIKITSKKPKVGTMFVDYTYNSPQPFIISSIERNSDNTDYYIRAFNPKFGENDWGCAGAFNDFVLDNRVIILWKPSK